MEKWIPHLNTFKGSLLNAVMRCFFLEFFTSALVILVSVLYEGWVNFLEGRYIFNCK